jgi:starch synthase
MASGCAVVASRVDGIPDAVIDGETGLLVPPEDPAALARALDAVLADPAFADRLGAAGARRAREGFAWSIVARRYVAVLECALHPDRS